MSLRGRFLLLVSLVISDAGGVLLAWLAAYLVVVQRWPMQPEYRWAMGLSLGPWLMVFAAQRLYDLDIILEDSQEYATLATGCTYGMLLLIVISTLAHASNLAPAWLFAGWLFSILGAGGGRFILRRVVRALRRRGHLLSAALIVGADEQGRAIARQFKTVAASGLRVMGFVDDFLPAGTLVQDDLRVLGPPSALPEIIAEQHVTEMVVVPGALAWESFQEVLEHLTLAGGPRLRLSPGYYDLFSATPRVAHRNFVPLFVVDSARLSGFDAWLKFMLDYGVGAGLALLGLPLMMGLAVGLALSGGPVFVTEEYLGLRGRSFRARLFRAAPRGWLAGTGLNRLPLVWAVLRGQMSLCGPRPVPVRERDTYRRWLPTLASVKPGLSGPWAVVPVAALEEEMRAAVYYIRSWTIWLDLQILTQTVLVTLRGKWGGLE